MLKFLFALTLGLGLLTTVLPVQAAEFRSVNEQSDSVNVNNDEIVKDLHIAGNNIIVNADVRGDLLTAGNTVSIIGDVENSLFVVGGDITVRGNIGHHARLIGNKITLSGGTISGDVFIAANQLVIAKEVTINGQLYASTNNLSLHGTVNGRVNLSGNEAVINGVTGNFLAKVNKLTINSSALINGNLEYRSRNQATVDPSAQITGETIFTQSKTSGLGINYFTFIGIIGAFLLAWLLVRFRRPMSMAILKRAVAQPLINIAIGAAVLLLVPIVTILLMFSIIGSPIGLLLLFLWIVALLVGSLFGKLVLGSWLMKLLTKEADYKLDWQALLAGIVIANLWIFIPIIGGVLESLVMLLGLGAVVAYAIRPTTAK